MKSSALASGLMLAALVAFSSGTAIGDSPPAMVCGGVGSDDRAALASGMPGANLSLEMFIAKGGEYVADADVKLMRLGSREPAFAARADGPICYLRVAPGRYRIEATFEGVTRSATATVAPSATKPVHVALAFPKSVGDRQTDAASPEEKAQARRP
jgi:hypothetical protein